MLHIFTEPAWRRRGLAELLMRHVLEWARNQRLDRLVLHASAEGRALYERLGFVATNEMRFSGSLIGRLSSTLVRSRSAKSSRSCVSLSCDCSPST